MKRLESKTIYSDPQKVPSKYKKYKLRDFSIPILRRKRPKDIKVGYWDEHKKLEKYFKEEYPDIPNFSRLDVAKKCTYYKCAETIAWLNAFVYECHTNYFRDNIVSICEITDAKIDTVASKFSKAVQPELRKHFLMACIAKDFDEYVHDHYVYFHDNMLVSYIVSHLHFKLKDRQEFVYAATQYVCQRIIERGERQFRHVFFSNFRMGTEGWLNQIKDEPLNYFIFEGRNFCHNRLSPKKEEFEEAIRDFDEFKAGIIIKSRIPKKEKMKEQKDLLSKKRKFEAEEEENLSCKNFERDQPQKRGRPKKSETNKKSNIRENKMLVKRGIKRKQEENRSLLKKKRLQAEEEISFHQKSAKDQLHKRRGRPAKQKKLETNKENLACEHPNDQQHKRRGRPRKIICLEAGKENLLKPYKDEQRDGKIQPTSDIEISDEESTSDIETLATFVEDSTAEIESAATFVDSTAEIETETNYVEDSAFPTPGTSYEHASIENSDKYSASNSKLTFSGMFEADKRFETVHQAMMYHYYAHKQSETIQQTTTQVVTDNFSELLYRASRQCSPSIILRHS